MQSLKNNADFCGSLPLHLINQIQEYGVLIVIDDASRIVQVSRNIQSLLEADPEDVCDTPFYDWLDMASVKKIANSKSRSAGGRILLTLTFLPHHREWPVLVHYKEGYAILEVEMVELPNRLFITMYEELKEDISAINEAADVISLSGAALAALKQRSGFDRIMIYKFDEAWNGTVIAESMEEGMEPYLGLRFPESDVPRQARQLYFRNPYRLIPDRDFNPVKLYPVINPVINTFSDLSDCNLRSVAGVHLEYLKNMGVMASMSTRILKNGQLWGLISCHHREAKMMSQEQCAVFELLSDVISARLSAIEHKEYALESEALNTELASIVERLYQSDSLSHALLQQEVADRLGASGLVLTTGEQPDRIGSAPGEQDITPLIFWLGSRHPNAIFSSRSLGADFEEAAQYKEHASGLLSIPVRSDKPAYLLAFRPELVEEVAWGGNPQEALQLEADGKTYHPRASFKKWQQTVSGSSKPWQEQELRFATALRHAINDYLLLR